MVNFWYGIGPICIEQGWCSSAIGKAEIIARDPLASIHMPVQKCVGCIERRSPAIAAVVMFTTKRNINKTLLRIIYVVIEEPIPHSHIRTDNRIRRDQLLGLG